MTSSVMYWQDTRAINAYQKNFTLSDALNNIGPWIKTDDIPLDENIVNELKLDDFIFRNFTDGSQTLSLYIGYYNTMKKVGAAHDPLVCFPGQGWVLQDINEDTLNIELDGQDKKINYSRMIAERNGKRILLFYWFQAHDQAKSGTLSQKFSLLLSKILGNSGDNAFVRISMPLEGRNNFECLSVVKSFVKDLYPVLIKYIRTSVKLGEE